MLTLICGLPRSGKTTYSKQYEGNCIVLHLDLCGRYNGVTGRVRNIHGDVVVEGVYDTAERRKALLRSYTGTGAKCIWLNTPLSVRQERVGYRRVSHEIFEPPTYEEGWDEIIVIGENYGL